MDEFSIVPAPFVFVLYCKTSNKQKQLFQNKKNFQVCSKANSDEALNQNRHIKHIILSYISPMKEKSIIFKLKTLQTS